MLFTYIILLIILPPAQPPYKKSSLFSKYTIVIILIVALFLFLFFPIITVASCEGTVYHHFIIEFKNLHLTENLKLTKDTLQNFSGIYAIKCLETGAMYIGSAID